MDILVLKEFFMWLTVLNLAIMILQATLCMLLKDLVCHMHGKLFGLSPNAVKTAIYGYLGVYKVVFIVFCLTPWLALVIMS